MNSKLHAVYDEAGRPLVMLLSEGQMSDHKGARLALSASPPVTRLIADRSYDSSEIRRAVLARSVVSCIP